MPRGRCRGRAPRPIPGQCAVIGKWRTGFDIIVDSDDVVDGAPRIVIAGVELCRVARVDGLQLVTIAAIEIGSASCGERGCEYVENSEVAVSLKKNKNTYTK